MNNIEILEDYIKLINKGYCEDCNELCNIYGAPAFPSKAIAKAIENLIQDYKELKEETTENQDYIKDLQKKLTNAIEIKYIHQDYIPKSKLKELEEYANWHIEHLTEDIADYIDDDRKGNASIIGEFKEEREHWKDIIRIINNEKTYIDYKIY